MTSSSGVVPPVRVGVVGLGVIGKRVAAAVEAQPDLCLAGVLVRTPSPNVLRAAQRGWPLFADAPHARVLADLGVATHAGLDALLSAADVVVDCSPRGRAAERLAVYEHVGVRPVLCGGEELSLGLPTFSTFLTFDAARRAGGARVASCNATALGRLLGPMRTCGLERAFVNVVRCATDPDKARKGSVASAVVTLGRSRHADELATLMPDIELHTHAQAVPMIHGHVLSCDVAFDRPVAWAAEALERAPRVEIVSRHPTDTAALTDDAHGAASGRATVLVWRESIVATGHRLSLQAHVHMEAVTIPDTVDAVRAVAGVADAAASATTTDRALGILGVDGHYPAASFGSPRSRGGGGASSWEHPATAVGPSVRLSP